MTVGPMELLVVGFEGNDFKGEIAPAILEAVETGAIRVVDLIFARKDSDGAVTAFEIEEADEAYARNLMGITDDVHDILTEEEAITIADMLPLNTSAMVALIEHSWAIRISEAVQRAGGRLLASQRISPRLIDEVRSELDEVLAEAPTRRQWQMERQG